MLFLLTEDQLVCFNYNSKQGSPDEEEEDPGIVFIFSDEASIHICLMLPSVATVAGTYGDQKLM